MSDWFEDTHAGVPRDFPPPLKIEPGKVYNLTFEGKSPKVVIGAFSRKTAVIVVDYQGERKSLYLSQVDLARQIANLNDTVGSLDKVRVEIAMVPGKGRGYRFAVAPVGKRMTSMLEVFRNKDEIDQRLQGEIKSTVLAQLNLQLSYADAERHIDKAVHLIRNDIELNFPDDQQSWDKHVINPIVTGLRKYVKDTGITKLRAQGLNIEQQRVGVSFHVVASIYY